MTVKPIPGQPSSAEVRAELAQSGPVLLAFSRGKDSVAAWLALAEAGVQVVPYHLYLTPGLEFVDADLKRWETFFGQEIISLPHPSLLMWLRSLQCQTEDRVPHLLAADLPEVDYADVIEMVCEAHGLDPAGTWVADGVRAADSPARRVAFADHGVWRRKGRKVSPVWDWDKADLTACFETNGVQLGRDYGLFGRSHDGIDARFLTPIEQHEPGDWATTLEWWPTCESDIIREVLWRAELDRIAPLPAGKADYRARKAREKARASMAGDSEAALTVTFADAAERDEFLAASGCEVHRDRFLIGADLAAAHGIAPRKSPLKAGVAGKAQPTRAAEQAWMRRMPTVPDPIPDLPEPTTVTEWTESARAELEGIRSAFGSPPDSWCGVVFPSRQRKLDFMFAAGMIACPERFISGDMLTRALSSTT